MVEVSAPGKVHLIGEHAVVYGKPAIIAAIGRRMYVNVEESDRVVIKAADSDWKADLSVEDVLSFVQKLNEIWKSGLEGRDFSKLFSELGVGVAGFRKAMIGKSLEMLKVDGGVSLTIEDKSDVPSGSGLGSSAALAVAVPKAVSELYGLNTPIERINEVAFEIERFMHGNPSGGDNSTCCFGGLVWFQRGEPNIIKSLKEEIPYELENFVLVYTGKPKKSTGELIQQVAGLEEAFRNQRIGALGNAANEMRDALKAKDFSKVRGLMNLAQKNLADLGVSTPTIDKIAEAVRGIGGAAKLCGAGGGGIVLCHHEDKDKLTEVIKSLGHEPMETELGCEGVKAE